MAKKVYIGSGHGGSDPGAVSANRVKEKDLNLAIALACEEELKRHGVEVMMSKRKDEDDPYSVTLPEVNRYAPSCAVEIHNNAGGGDGCEVYHSKRDPADDALAKNILDAMVAIGQNSRGLKTKERSDGSAWFAWIRELSCPAVLVECAFVDTKDIEIVDTAEEQKTMGIAIAKGILKTIGVTWKEPEKPKVTQTVEAGDLVSLTPNAVYYQGWVIPSWVKSHYWFVDSVKGDRAVLGKNQSGFNNINSPVNTKYLTVVEKGKPVKVEEPKKKDLSTGAALSLNACLLYASSSAKNAVAKKTGVFYVWDGAQLRGRIRITNKPENVGKTGQVTGWINVSDI